MKFSTLSVSLVASLAAATPTPTVEKAANNVNAKRASVSDVCSLIEHLNRLYTNFKTGCYWYICHFDYLTSDLQFLKALPLRMAELPEV